MSEGDRNGQLTTKWLAQFLVLTAIVGFALWIIYNERHAEQAKQSTHSDSENAHVACSGSIDIASAISCTVENVEASQDQKNAAYDLEAQQDMAEWALLMLVATSAGVILLFFTWRETVRVTKETRRIGEAQTRAYVTFQHVRLWIRPDLNCLSLDIALENTGQTPACHITAKIKIGSPDIAAQALEITENLTDIAGGEPGGQKTSYLNLPIVDASGNAIPYENIGNAFADVRVEGEDVFGVPFVAHGIFRKTFSANENRTDPEPVGSLIGPWYKYGDQKQNKKWLKFPSP